MNLESTFLMVQAALEPMRRQGYGQTLIVDGGQILPESPDAILPPR